MNTSLPEEHAFPEGYNLYEETCQRKRHLGFDTDVNRTRLKDIVIERFPVLKDEIGFRREVMIVPTSAIQI